LAGSDTTAEIIDTDRISEEAADPRWRFVVQNQGESIIRREIMHQPRRLPEDRIDIFTNVFWRNGTKCHLERQLHRLHFGDQLPQKKVAKTPRTLCPPGENQESGPQRVLPTSNEAPGPGSPDNKTIPFQLGEQVVSSLITDRESLGNVTRRNEPLTGPP
jgi:hypothetical protein